MSLCFKNQIPLERNNISRRLGNPRACDDADLRCHKVGVPGMAKTLTSEAHYFDGD